MDSGMAKAKTGHPVSSETGMCFGFQAECAGSVGGS